MDILEVLDQVRELLQSKGRVTYRILKRQFALDDEALEDIKGELITAERVARDEDGGVLVWVGTDVQGEKAKGGKGERGRKTESENWGNGELGKRRIGDHHPTPNCLHAAAFSRAYPRRTSRYGSPCRYRWRT